MVSSDTERYEVSLTSSKGTPMISEFFTDKEGEIVFITTYVEEERENLVKMYETFSRTKRCCGLPPVRRNMIESWISALYEKGINFIAKHGDRVIAHLAVVKENEVAEFVIFVHQDYEGRWIGGEMIKFAERFLPEFGIKKLKAMTERSNRDAIGLYLHLGFKVEKSDGIYTYLTKELQ
jgi:RimJ/RimL family protein N-acetyltransferase